MEGPGRSVLSGDDRHRKLHAGMVSAGQIRGALGSYLRECIDACLTHVP